MRSESKGGKDIRASLRCYNAKEAVSRLLLHNLVCEYRRDDDISGGK